MKEKIKDKKIIISYGIVLILLGIGFSYALNTTSSLKLTSGVVKIDEDAYGNTSFDSSDIELRPVLDEEVEEKSSNIIKIDFTVGGSSENTSKNIIYDISLSNLKVDCSLLSPFVKWKLVKNNTEISNGSLDYQFDTMDDKGRIVLTNIQQDLPEYNAKKIGYDHYSFYMWLSDSCQKNNINECMNNDNQSKLMGKKLAGKIEVELNTETKRSLTRNPSTTLDESSCIS